MASYDGIRVAADGGSPTSKHTSIPCSLPIASTHPAQMDEARVDVVSHLIEDAKKKGLNDEKKMWLRGDSVTLLVAGRCFFPYPVQMLNSTVY